MAQIPSETRYSNRRTPDRSNKFPLTLHAAGQYCKKIHGRMCYFGQSQQKALQLYHEQATSLHTGRGGLTQKVNEITTLQVQSYREKLIEEGKCSDAIDSKLSAVKSLFNRAGENGVAGTYPQRGLKSPLVVLPYRCRSHFRAMTSFLH